jgi:hypothetical protein
MILEMRLLTKYLCILRLSQIYFFDAAFLCQLDCGAIELRVNCIFDREISGFPASIKLISLFYAMKNFSSTRLKMNLVIAGKTVDRSAKKTRRDVRD